MAGPRILLVRLGAMGDILHTLPAAATVRANLPDARIAWLVEPRWQPLLEGHPALDECIPFDRRQWRQLPSRIAALRARGFDLAIDFQGLLKSALPARLCGAARVMGYSREAARERWAALFYTRVCQPRSAHIVDRHLELALMAAGPQRVVRFDVPPGREEAPLPERFVLASPLAGWGAKQWPLERYGELAGLLAAQFAMPLVLNGAPAQAEALRAIPGVTVHVSGLPGLIDATRRAAAVIGLDSGPLHLAAALRKPGVALFGPTDPARNGPYCETITVLRDATSRTSYRRTSGTESGMAATGAARVMEILSGVLRQAPAAPPVPRATA